MGKIKSTDSRYREERTDTKNVTKQNQQEMGKEEGEEN